MASQYPTEHIEEADKRSNGLGCCCCCIVVLRPRQTSKVMSGWSVNLTTLFMGRLRPPKRLTSTSCTYFRQ